jgi:uncharacterized protein YraI
VIREGRTTGEVGHVVDLMPTCVDVAQAEYPKTFKGHEILPMEGKSLAPVLENAASLGERPIFWEHEGNRAVRLGRWKLVSKHPGRWELFDLEADRTEMHSLAEAEPAVVTGDVNLRSGPSTRYAVIDTMPAGATVNVYDCGGGWCQVSWAGVRGFASSRYLDGGVPVYAAAPPVYRYAPPPVVYGGPSVSFGFGFGSGPRVHRWDRDRDRDRHHRRGDRRGHR